MEQQNPMNPQNAPQGQWPQGAQGAPYPGQQPPYPGQYQGQQYGQYPGQQQWQQGMPVSYAAPYARFDVAIKTWWKKLFNCSGRASRSEYWFVVVFITLVWAVIVLSAPHAVSKVIGSISFYFQPLLLGSLTVRRLHDIGWSGWWAPVMLLFSWGFFLGASTLGVYAWLLLIALFLFTIPMQFFKGEDAPNRFDAGRAPQPQQAQPYPQQYPVYGAAPAQGAPYPGQQPMPQQWPQGAMPPQGAQPVPPAAPQPPQQPPAQQQ